MAVLTPKDAYDLFHEGTIELAKIEGNGIRIDMDRLNKNMARCYRKIARLEKDFKKEKIWKHWKELYRRKANMYSGEQLGEVLQQKIGIVPAETTATGKMSTTEENLLALDMPELSILLEIGKLKKAADTFLKGIKKETQDGFLHPVFNLHLVKTFRSSSDSPNFQNFPVRNPILGKLIRSCFIPREGHRLVEIDYSGIEVRIATCYHKDPNMVLEIKDPSRDMHRDCAAECFMVEPRQVTKKMRYCGKNMFVFPQFYGDWYIGCARSLWEAMDTMDLGFKYESAFIGKDEMSPLKAYLSEQHGIHELGSTDPKNAAGPGTFVHHIQQVEKRLWEERFPVYKAWKEKWQRKYERRTCFDLKTGFHIEGSYSRKEVINYPVQGAAFHCLLWSLIRLNRTLEERGMKTVLVGQIHDSIVADVADNELQEYLAIAKQIMTIDIRKAWPWIIVPLDVEAEVTPVGGSWFEKEEMEIK